MTNKVKLPLPLTYERSHNNDMTIRACLIDQYEYGRKDIHCTQTN